MQVLLTWQFAKIGKWNADHDVRYGLINNVC